MSTLSTVPPRLEIARNETRIWPHDTTPTLVAMNLSGPSSPAVTVVDPVTDTAVAGAVTSVSLAGNIITATIGGGVLTLNKNYIIRWTVTIAGQVVTWTTDTLAVVA